MDCHQPSIKYTEFSKRINDIVEKTNIPLSGAFEITDRCNMRCTHCYMTEPEIKKELTTKQVLKIINQIANAGCLWLLITGGEPLIRKDFFEIYKHAIDRGILITLFTNGTLVTKKVADFLEKYPPFSVEISIYGATEKTHEKITTIPGSFKKCIQGIKMLKKRDIPLKLKTMGLKSNQHEIKAMKELAKKLDIPFRFDPLINPQIDGSSQPLKERLSPKEVIALEKQDKERSSEWSKLCDKYFGYKPGDYIYTCSAGKNYFHIDAQGKLNMCVLLRLPGYEITKGTFKEGYSQFKKIRMAKKTDKNKCSECEINILCGLCPGWSLLEKGNVSQPVEYLCEVAHLRSLAFNKKKGGEK
jgi:radical SAM protein with 4Fe4S-binding SPASM domain